MRIRRSNRPVLVTPRGAGQQPWYIPADTKSDPLILMLYFIWYLLQAASMLSSTFIVESIFGVQMVNSLNIGQYVFVFTIFFFYAALKFDPDRFLDERLHKYLVANPFIFCPFNAGPRICLGQQLAYNKATFFLVRLLQRFTGFKLDSRVNIQPPADWATGSGTKPTEKVHSLSHLTLYVKVWSCIGGSFRLSGLNPKLCRAGSGFVWTNWRRRSLYVTFKKNKARCYVK